MSINIEIRHIRVVLAVFDSGGYTAAAQSLHISQSAISRTVKEVEDVLGTPLFTRTTRRVVPTDDGEHFIAIGRALVAQYDTGFNHFSGYLAGKRGSVVVATVTSVASTLLPPILSSYCHDHPSTMVSIQDGFSQETLESVAIGSVDFAVTALHNVPARLVSETIAADSFLCIFGANHRFNQVKEVNWADLQGESMIEFDHNSSIFQQINSLLNELGVTPRPVLQAKEVSAIGGLVSAGIGVAIIPALLLPTVQFANLSHKVVTSPLLERRIGIVFDGLRPLAQPALDLMDVLRRASQQTIPLPQGVRWVDSDAQFKKNIIEGYGLAKSSKI